MHLNLCRAAIPGFCSLHDEYPIQEFENVVGLNSGSRGPKRPGLPPFGREKKGGGRKIKKKERRKTKKKDKRKKKSE